MADHSRFQGIPNIIYGTAFKFDKSASLVEAALNAGFRAIDTAGSKSAYREALVGEGIAAALANGTFKRNELYTKFSPFKQGKDPALYPYNTTKTITEQVAQSVPSSLANLGIDYIDCLVLHSLYADIQDTLTAWRAMEALVPSKVASLGLVAAQDMRSGHGQTLRGAEPLHSGHCRQANPNFPSDLPLPLVTFDRDVRGYCQQHGIAYAPWGLLWGSLDVLDAEQLMTIAGRGVGIDKHIACFALMQSVGGCQITILCGTTNEGRMHETLGGLAKMQKYLAESETNRETWSGYVDSLKVVIDGIQKMG
ncbi:Aldo-keto reductase 2E [Hyphodiscus hymeniophilus]|uniref:Aldo-keto reductase 2E n=1 Tax=Hyphodiscus hymeniophilus TaxID=353542 RepID=A0A9P7B0N9_9HELO|nr:Aldo-keto reductase 2E [Hyphodiscus hymeniophilus]